MLVCAHMGPFGSSLGGFYDRPDDDPQSGVEGGKFEELDHVH